VQVTREAFCDTAMKYAEGNVSLFEFFDNSVPADVDVKKPKEANLGLVGCMIKSAK